MMGKIKLYGLIALSLLATIFFALFKSEQAGRAKDRLKGEIQARKTGQAANEAMMGGLNDEEAANNKAADPSNTSRNGFE